MAVFGDMRQPQFARGQGIKPLGTIKLTAVERQSAL